MKTDAIRVLYVDEVETDRKIFGNLLSTRGRLRIVGTPPPETISGEAIKLDSFDLFLIDYQLSKRDSSGRRVGYQGGSLATAIREIAPEVPIVTLTRQGVIVQVDVQQQRLSDVFDGIVFKGDVQTDPDRWKEFLIRTAEGFRSLRSGRHHWKSLLEKLGATEEEEASLLEAAPPLRPAGDWQARDVARWLRDVIFAYPGILVDSVNFATLLGIDAQNLGDPAIRQIVRDAKYSGIFSPLDGRWWRSRIVRSATRLMIQAGVDGSIIPGFMNAFEKKYGRKLKSARCIFSGKTQADVVCFIYRQPVRREYSLPYFADNRPPVMDQARVSFKAIRESNDVVDEKFGKEALPLLERIRRMTKPA